MAVTLVALPTNCTFSIVASPSASKAPGPLGPESAVLRTLTLTLLLLTRVFWSVSVAEPHEHIAASAPNGSPTGFETLTLLPFRVELRIVATTPSFRWMPPLNAFD